MPWSDLVEDESDPEQVVALLPRPKGRPRKLRPPAAAAAAAAAAPANDIVLAPLPWFAGLRGLGSPLGESIVVAATAGEQRKV